MLHFDGSHMKLWMRLGLWLAGFAVVVVFAVLNLGFDPTFAEFAAPVETRSDSPVDQSIFFTSRTLAGLAATPQEQRLAVLAVRYADHELDQSFATAIRDSASSRVPLPAPAIATSRRIAEVRAQIRTDNAKIESLLHNSDSLETETNAEQLRVTEAQLTLENDELDNLQQDLARFGGDKQQKLQQAFDQHHAIAGQASALTQKTATTPPESAANLPFLLGKFRIFRSLQERGNSLAEADANVDRAMVVLRQMHEELKAKGGESKVSGLTRDPTRSASVVDLQLLSGRQKDMGDLDKRIRDLGQLRAVYNDWQSLIQAQTHTIKLGVIADGLSIVMTFLGLFVISGLVQAALKRGERKYNRRLDHFRVLISLVLEVIVVARIAVVIFGLPSDVSTIVGLVTAGITVALKDFLVSFVGWFALMGKRGIQVGDWVEIDGTQGEVLKVTSLHTYLLETGNWATDGHPTGRQAVFMNKFAVEKKYFNFSTREQWLWDEIKIPVPITKEIRPDLLAKLQSLVEQQTKEDAAQATSSWRDIEKTHDLAARPVTPAVVVRTAPAGLEIVVRYVSKASRRFDTAVCLRQKVLSALELGISANR